MSQRAAELFRLVDAFNETHDSWVEDANQEYPTLAYWAAFDRMLEGFENGDLPGNCRDLAVAVYTLAKERATFDLSDDMNPHDGFWYARQKLLEAAAKLRNPDEKFHIEPISELYKQGVSPEQIGRMWGLLKSDGSGDSSKVQQEIARPGSIITENYVHPREKERAKEAEQARRQYHELSSQVQKQQAAQAETVSKPCPESSEELFLQKVSLEQASRMLKRDQSELAKEWAGFAAQQTQQAQQRVDTPLSQPVISGNVNEPLPAEAATDVDDLAPQEYPESVDPYAQFEEWENKHIKIRLKELGLKAAKGASREAMLDQILEAEARGIPIDAQGEPVVQE